MFTVFTNDSKQTNCQHSYSQTVPEEERVKRVILSESYNQLDLVSHEVSIR